MFLQHTIWTVIISLSMIILTVIVNSWLWLYYSQHATRPVWSVCPVITICSYLVVLRSVCYCVCLACLSPIAEDGNLSVVVGEVCWNIQYRYSSIGIINIQFSFYSLPNSLNSSSLILNITFHHHSANRSWTSRNLINSKIYSHYCGVDVICGRHLVDKKTVIMLLYLGILVINLSYIQTVFSLDSSPFGKGLGSRVDKLDPQTQREVLPLTITDTAIFDVKELSIRLRL